MKKDQADEHAEKECDLNDKKFDDAVYRIDDKVNRGLEA